jgi:heme/copper-type cytochrome/quinol oxidase subunit 3
MSGPEAAIPHDVEPHPVTGMPNGRLGVWLFLASEVMLFGALFSSYLLLRAGAPQWPPEGGRASDLLSVPLATLNTVVLITSSITMVLAWAAAVQGQLARTRLYLGATLACALVFLCVKAVEYSAELHHGKKPSTDTFYAIYFTLTGLHGLHIVGGVLMIGALLLTSGQLAGPGARAFANRVENTGLYWHFVDLVWIFLFPALYLL